MKPISKMLIGEGKKSSFFLSMVGHARNFTETLKRLLSKMRMTNDKFRAKGQ